MQKTGIPLPLTFSPAGRNASAFRNHSIILLAAMLFALCLAPLPGLAEKAQTQVIILGSGSPVPDPDRSGPALAIVVNDTSYLIDCGTGCVRQATKVFQEKGVQSLSISKLGTVFFTHLHSDHTLGYPDLILTTWDHRDKPLEVYGPASTQSMTDYILKAYGEDIKVRTEGLQESDPATVIPNVHEIQADGIIFKDANVRVSAFLVPHGSFPNSYGYKFVTPDRIIVISGDTAPSNTVAEQATGSDMLVHEVYAMAKYDKVSDQIKMYLQSFHTSTTQLAEIAGKAKPKLLVPIHMLGYQGLAQGTIEKEIRAAGYTGDLANTEDLDIF